MIVVRILTRQLLERGLGADVLDLGNGVFLRSIDFGPVVSSPYMEVELRYEAIEVVGYQATYARARLEQRGFTVLIDRDTEGVTVTWT